MLFLGFFAYSSAIPFMEFSKQPYYETISHFEKAPNCQIGAFFSFFLQFYSKNPEKASPNYSWRNASMGLSFAAFLAG